MARFISRYANHRLKTPGGTIEFQRNEFVTEDDAKADYLRRHPDFGVVIFEDKAEEKKPGGRRVGKVEDS